MTKNALPLIFPTISSYGHDQPTQPCYQLFNVLKHLSMVILCMIISLANLSCSDGKSDDMDDVPNSLNPKVEIDGEFLVTTNYLKDSIFSITDADRQSDGKLIVIARLTNTSSEKVYRIDLEGNLDLSFDIDKDKTWLIRNFRKVIVLPNGNIIIAGQFSVDGKTKHLLRLSSDGKLDRSFDSAPFSDRGDNENSPILFIGSQSDGKIIVGGYFTSIGNTYRPALARVNANGSLDESFKLDQVNANSSILNVEFLRDGKMLVCGDFLTTVNPRRFVSRINSDGSVDPEFIFRERLGGGIPAPMIGKTMTLLSGKILIGGRFGPIINPTVRDGTYEYYNFACLNSDGSPDLTFEKIPILEALGVVQDIAILPSGKLLVGRSSGSENNYISVIDSNGKLDRNLKLTFKRGGISKFFKINDKKYVVVGDFGIYHKERTTPIIVIDVQ